MCFIDLNPLAPNGPVWARQFFSVILTPDFYIVYFFPTFLFMIQEYDPEKSLSSFLVQNIMPNIYFLITLFGNRYS